LAQVAWVVNVEPAREPRWLEFPMRVRDLAAQKRPSCSANPSRPRAWGMPGARCTRSLACKK